MQARFEVDEEYQRIAVLKQMGGLCRSSKSRLVTQISDADNNQQRMNLRPKNVPSLSGTNSLSSKLAMNLRYTFDIE